jgi:hypothetical protein
MAAGRRGEERMRDKFAFFSLGEQGAPDDTPGAESAITRRQQPTANAAGRVHSCRPRDLNVSLRLPVRRVWLTALASVAFFAVMTRLFAFTNWNKAVLVSFLVVEALFVCLGVYWTIVGLPHERPWILLGGFTILFPPGFVAFNSIGTVWYGGEHRVVSFRVTDDKDGTPIPGASVRFLFGWEGPEPEWETNAAGEVDIESYFQTYGSWSYFHRRAIIDVRPNSVRVNAEGYQPVSNSLGEFTDGTRDLNGPPIPLIEIRLKRE